MYGRKVIVLTFTLSGTEPQILIVSYSVDPGSILHIGIVDEFLLFNRKNLCTGIND